MSKRAAPANDIPRCPQRQDSLRDQLKDLIEVANRLGMYDAADYIKRNQEKQS